MGFIPKSFTHYNQDILLIDPWYYEEVKDNEEFERFIKEQNVKIVEVKKNETHFNPANFLQVSDTMIVLNYCPGTKKRLKLKEGMSMMLPNVRSAIKALPAMGGSLGCLASPMERLPEYSQSKILENSSYSIINGVMRSV